MTSYVWHVTLALSESFLTYSSNKNGGTYYSLNSSNSLCVFIKILLSFVKGYSIPVLGKFSIFFLNFIELPGKGDFWLLKLTETELFLLLSYSAAPFCNLKLF